ncbi:uncharacterized protein LOC143549833 [Bidens hawaiensis]|uniref:uncharacterized protein LOC143549833 n=1 Tax=Bidens hawaiensis TaxID=980011 RepID=UPI00404ADFC4
MDAIAAQLAAMASRLDSIESLKEEVAALKNQSPNFNRFKNPRGWTLKPEKYFRYYHIPDEEKVDVSSMHLEGDALDLYSWLSVDQTVSIWEELIQAFQKNFGPAEFENPDEYLISIKQTGYAQEYRQEFAKRSARVSNWPEHCLLGVFLNGLKEELKTDVRIQRPRKVYNAASLAIEYESKIGANKPSKNTTWSPCPKPNIADTKSITHTNTHNPTTQRPPLRISEAEKQTRLSKGECYRYAEKYGPGHRCKTGTFKLFEASDGSDEPIHTSNEEEFVEQEGFAKISMYAIFGKSNITTMKLQGTLGTTEVLILVDCGSTHNFIFDTLVRELKMVSQFINPFGVQIGNDDIIKCNQLCKDVSVKLTDLTIVQDFYPFTIGGADLVLGIQWLSTLNTIQANWNEMFMIFTIDGKKYKLQVVFLGHVITSTGVHVEQERISAIQSWPIPTSVKEVRGFLGLTGYYRRFICNYGLIARPLTALTKKDGFNWSMEAITAFQQLKQALMSTPVLRLPDFTKDFTVECDASSEGVGAILSQEDHPVAYFSKGFSPSNHFKSAYDRELLALRITTTEQQRLLLKLMPYDFSITHRAGKENKGADALSRRPHSTDLFTLSVPYSFETVNIKAGLLLDPYTSNIISQLTADPTSVADFSLVGQLLFYKQRMVIPDTADIRSKLLHEAHATPVGGHSGFLKTLKRISAQYFWPNLSKTSVFLFNNV